MNNSTKFAPCTRRARASACPRRPTVSSSLGEGVLRGARISAIGHAGLPACPCSLWPTAQPPRPASPHDVEHWLASTLCRGCLSCPALAALPAPVPAACWMLSFMSPRLLPCLLHRGSSHCRLPASSGLPATSSSYTPAGRCWGDVGGRNARVPFPLASKVSIR